MTDLRNITPMPSGHFRVRIEHLGEVLSGVVATHAEALDLRDELKRQIVDGESAPTKGSTPSHLRGRILGSRDTNRSADDDSSRWDNHIANAPWARKGVDAISRADGSAWLRALTRKRLSFDPKRPRPAPRHLPELAEPKALSQSRSRVLPVGDR